MSTPAELRTAPAELYFWLDLVRARIAGLLHRLGDPGAPDRRVSR